MKVSIRLERVDTREHFYTWNVTPENCESGSKDENVNEKKNNVMT